MSFCRRRIPLRVSEGRDHVPDAFPTERCSRTTAKDILGCDLDRDCDLHDLCVDPLRIEWPIGCQDTYYGRARFPTVELPRAWPLPSISIISSTFFITTHSLDPSTLLFNTSRWVPTFPSLASARSDLGKRSTLRSPTEATVQSPRLPRIPTSKQIPHHRHHRSRMSSILSTPKLDQSANGFARCTPCPASPQADCDGFQYLDARAFAGEESTAGSATDWNLQSSLPRASSHPPRTPPRRRMSWAFRRNHGDPFFGAKEAKASPVGALGDVRTPPATSGDMVQPDLPTITGSAPGTELSEQHQSPLAKRIIKRIPRILFPSSHQRPRSTSNARHMTELRNYDVSERAKRRATGSPLPNRGRGIDGSSTNDEGRMTWTITYLRLRFIVYWT
ncbi:hypothetical protein FFLO_04564 [Filobasidium floriforme]|uniref:Uncharacterized protein n=1 Tax=Filobasidium floriforme TaxID=5210 RepID=A0A8K0JIZ7_9TREE|nr:hypothetical protein FFLO_04564 [Filobasidium floriforme]